MRIAVCAGSFDPMTNGHLDLIVRAAALFDRVVVGVLANSAKRPMFGVADRLAMVRDVLAADTGLAHVRAEAFDGLLVDFVRHVGAMAVVRGLRSGSEFVDEAQMAQMNRHLSPACETIFLAASPDVAFISSRLVKEIAGLGGPIDGLVPPAVARRMARRGGSAADPIPV